MGLKEKEIMGLALLVSERSLGSYMSKFSRSLKGERYSVLGGRNKVKPKVVRVK